MRVSSLPRLVGYGAAGAAGAAVGGVGLLFSQAHQARRTIPRAQAPPPRADGRYGARLPGAAVAVAVLGDSVAAGYGVRKPRQTPGALLATGISRRLGRPVTLRVLAVVGATSARLSPQVAEALELRPDLAVIVIGGNDVTHGVPPAASVRDLRDAVTELRAGGVAVVVGTCPDLGTILPIRRPLRWLARAWSRRLAAAQAIAVVEAGGWAVSLADLIGPRFEAEPYRMFGSDRFHPSPDGYATAAAVLLPTTLAALGAAPPSAVTGVRSLPRAAEEASRRGGTELSGASVSRPPPGPAGRWAALRRRVRSVVPAYPASQTPAQPAEPVES